jgi:hypothetical protein
MIQIKKAGDWLLLAAPEKQDFGFCRKELPYRRKIAQRETGFFGISEQFNYF